MSMPQPACHAAQQVRKKSLCWKKVAQHTLCIIKVTFFILLKFIQTLTNVYNILPPEYTELIFNTTYIYPPYLRTAATLPSDQRYTLPLHKLKNSMLTQTVCTSAWVFNRLIFDPHRSEVSYTPFINSTNHNALRQAIPGVNQALPQVGHVLNWCPTHTILHHAPYLIVNWIKIRAIWRL